MRSAGGPRHRGGGDLRWIRTALFDVRDGEPKQMNDVLVVEGIENLSSGAARPDQAHAAQQPQLMRHGRLADAHQRCDVTYAQLAFREDVENADASRVAQDAKRLGNRLDRSTREEQLAPGGRFVFSEMWKIAVQVAHV